MSGVAQPNPVVRPDVSNATPLSGDGMSSANDTTKDTEETSLSTYIFIGLSIVILCLLFYYAYNRFITNSIKEPLTAGLKQERDDPVVDYNLRDEIRSLENLQRNILKKISTDAGI